MTSEPRCDEHDPSASSKRRASPTIFHRIMRLRPRRVYAAYYGMIAAAIVFAIVVSEWLPPPKPEATIHRAMTPDARRRIAGTDLRSMPRLFGPGAFVVAVADEPTPTVAPAIWFVHESRTICVTTTAKSLTPDHGTIDDPGAIDWDGIDLDRDALRTEAMQTARRLRQAKHWPPEPGQRIRGPGQRVDE